MKRYLIYGFLTILIITLNFAFIIVLTTDDVRINYKVLFFLWVVVLLAAGGLAYLEKTRKRKRKMANASSKPPKPKEPFTKKEDKFNTSNIYKNKCIQKAKIQLPENLTQKVAPGFFGGYVNNEEYSNETVQAVYTVEDQLLGYINKKKKQLCENLQLLYDEPVTCWGEITWDEFEKRFTAKVYIPILYSEPEMNKFRKMVVLKQELLSIHTAPEDPAVFKYLEKAENYYYLQQSVIAPPSLDYRFDPQLLLCVGSRLHEQEQWDKLVKLKKYPILISRLDQEQKKDILSHIKKAEKNTEI